MRAIGPVSFKVPKGGKMFTRRLFTMTILLSALVGAGATAKDAPSSPSIVLDKTIYFMAPDGSDAVTNPGAYYVEPAGVHAPARSRERQ